MGIEYCRVDPCTLKLDCVTFQDNTAHQRFRGIEWIKGLKIYDLKKVTFSTLFKLYIAGLGVLIKPA